MVEIDTVNLNLACPECKAQFTITDTHDLNFREVHTYETDTRCRNCRKVIHPEEALVTHISTTDQQPHVVPFSIGAYTNRGRGTFEVGKAHEKKIGGAGTDEKIDVIWLYDPNEIESPEDVTDAYVDPVVFAEGKVVAAAVPFGDGQISTITSLRDSVSEEDAPDEVDIGHRITMHLDWIQDPAWVVHLREASAALRSGNYMAVLPLLTATFENYLYRQIYRTMRFQGSTEDEIEDLFDKCRPGYYIKLEEMIKTGLKDVVGVNIADDDNEYHSTYHDYWVGVKKKRDEQIIHIWHTDNVSQISRDEAIEDFEATVNLIETVFEVCPNTVK